MVTGIRAVNAYGHSPGMMAFHIESGGQRLLNLGRRGQSLRHVDPAARVARRLRRRSRTRRSPRRKRIFDMVSTDKIAVVGFHMPFPSLGFVEKSGTGYRWVPASYQFNL